MKTAVRDKRKVNLFGLTVERVSAMLFIRLPSGRSLAYVRPRITKNRFGGESVSYLGVGPAKKWERIESYGPKFVENIVQGIARDLLAEAMLRLSQWGQTSLTHSAGESMGSDLPDSFCRKIVGHVHDEVIIEADPEDSVEEVCRIMGECPPWAQGLQLRADGYECEFYRKG